MTNSALIVFVLTVIFLSGTIFLQWERLRHYKSLSETDILTGLPNFQYFYKMLEKRIRNKENFSLVIIDIDHFRTYNNQSYKLGDEVLKEFVVKLREFIPEYAEIARFRMGDEFVILFNDTSLEKTQELLTAVKWSMTAHRFDCLNHLENAVVTFSEGIAVHSKNISNAEVLMAEAEKILKAQKQALLKHELNQ